MFLFTNLSSKLYSDILNKITKKEYFRNEILINKNKLVTSIYLVNRGSILDKDNNRIYNKEAIIGLNEIFSNKPFFDSTYITLENASVSLIYKEDLYTFMKDKTFLSNILSYLSSSIKLADNYSKILYHIIPLKRLLEYLYQESISNNSNKFYIPYSKGELAKILNISFKELSNNIKYLKDNNIITNENKLYEILDLNTLLYKLKDNES